MIKIYFVRHAQPQHDWVDDRTRPLTDEGKGDTKYVVEFFKDKKIDRFYCSTYKRSIDTIIDTVIEHKNEILIDEIYDTCNKNENRKQLDGIILDERLREREKGERGNVHGMFIKRWADHDFHEDGGESIKMLQTRNIEALKEILIENKDIADKKDINIVIGTHGAALSSILNYYDRNFGCEDFLRIIDWTPYIIELDFEKDNLINKIEHMHIEKEFIGKERADKKDDSNTSI